MHRRPWSRSGRCDRGAPAARRAALPSQRGPPPPAIVTADSWESPVNHAACRAAIPNRGPTGAQPVHVRSRTQMRAPAIAVGVAAEIDLSRRARSRLRSSYVALRARAPSWLHTEVTMKNWFLLLAL